MGQQKPKQNKEIIDPVEQAALKNAMNNFYAARQNDTQEIINKNTSTPQGTPLVTQPPVQQQVQMSGFQTPEDFEKNVYKQAITNVDPNLNVEFEIIKFPSKGQFYPSRVSEVVVEKMTSLDEDVLATTSLIENGTVLDVLIKRKIKTPGINTDELLVGDRNAILLFLRASSYGHEYDVRVVDPRTGIPFTSQVDLTALKPKEMVAQPDERGEFSLQLPVRKVMVKFKILNFREIQHVLKTAEAKQAAYNTEYSEFGSLKLKAEVVEIEGNRNKDYIVQFIDALPARDSAKLKQSVNDVTPDIDMNYEFAATDGYKFKAKVSVGVDFFFPFI